MCGSSLGEGRWRIKNPSGIARKLPILSQFLAITASQIRQFIPHDQRVEDCSGPTTYGELSYAAPGTSFTVDEDDTDFSYGVGGQFDVSEDVAAFVEWTRYFDESDYEVSGLTVGANFKF